MVRKVGEILILICILVWTNQLWVSEKPSNSKIGISKQKSRSTLIVRFVTLCAAYETERLFSLVGSTFYDGAVSDLVSFTLFSSSFGNFKKGKVKIQWDLALLWKIMS